MLLKTYRITISLKDPFTYAVFIGTITTMMSAEFSPGYEHIMAMYENTQNSDSGINDFQVNKSILSAESYKNADNLIYVDNSTKTIRFTNCGINVSQLSFLSNINDGTQPQQPVWNICHVDDDVYNIYNSHNDTVQQQVTVKITFMTDQFCFNTGTRIRCLSKTGIEEEVPIEKLSKGDLVKTFLHGYRPIVRIGKGVMFNNPRDVWNCMYEYPHSDYLTLTGGHAILCDTITNEERGRLTQLYRGGKIAMLDGKYVVFANASSLFRPVQNDSIYVYYHLALDGDGEIHRRFGIWANGVMAETSTIEHFTNQNYVTV
jgi:hypothetical protein